MPTDGTDQTGNTSSGGSSSTPSTKPKQQKSKLVETFEPESKISTKSAIVGAIVVLIVMTAVLVYLGSRS